MITRHMKRVIIEMVGEISAKNLVHISHDAADQLNIRALDHLGHHLADCAADDHINVHFFYQARPFYN